MADETRLTFPLQVFMIGDAHNVRHIHTTSKQTRAHCRACLVSLKSLRLELGRADIQVMVQPPWECLSLLLTQLSNINLKGNKLQPTRTVPAAFCIHPLSSSVRAPTDVCTDLLRAFMLVAIYLTVLEAGTRRPSGGHGVDVGVGDFGDGVGLLAICVRPANVKSSLFRKELTFASGACAMWAPAGRDCLSASDTPHTNEYLLLEMWCALTDAADNCLHIHAHVQSGQACRRQ